MSMSVTEAAKVWEESKRILDEHKPRLEAAAEVLKEYFRTNGKSTYRGRISYALSKRKRLDTKKVKAELGDRLADFQVDSRYETLSLLK